LRAIAPAYAVIPVGPNKFGHPSFRALTNLAKTNTKILRTDERGDIIFIINNNQLNIKTTK
jgi:beta-lactamase superfamily II metal-dependent hydrolase